MLHGVKVLPEALADDPDRLSRFEREAQALAALNHPNIAAVYAVGNRAIVMEFVEGEDLSARIARGPIPVAEALALSRQIADALAAAHGAGIIHRDLKPANQGTRLMRVSMTLSPSLIAQPARQIAQGSRKTSTGHWPV